MTTVQLDEIAHRESMEFDVVVVGAGPAGLSAAIRLKQVSPHLSVVVLEKGGEVGAHILSGAVVDPSGFDELLTDWRNEPDHPFRTPVIEDRFLLLTDGAAFPLPGLIMPPLMSNHGNFIVSLGEVTKWLALKAEALGVEIYPGFAAAQLVLDRKGVVVGVLTGDSGLDAEGRPSSQYTPGMVLLGKYVLLGEGARGSLAGAAIKLYELAKDSDPAKFGLGVKELWQVPPEQHKPGLVQHSFGWPLDNASGGGAFLYHFGENLVAVGMVLHLDYKNPNLSPFEELQRFKTHKAIRSVFDGGKRIGYGARAITEGGMQSIPNVSFPGGLLLGCAAGLVNLPRIKGVHNAVRSGMLAAEEVAAAIAAGRANDDLISYDASLRRGQVGDDLRRVRNVKPLWSRWGLFPGVGLGGLDMWCQTLFGWSPFGTLHHSATDAQSLEPASRHRSIEYPRPDNVLTFDRLSSVFLSGTNHTEDQPVHLKVADLDLHRRSELGVFGGPSTRYCPAGVYEWVDAQGKPISDATAPEARFVINAQNCVHCKTCDIKDPNGNITWVPPQGGEGPIYMKM